MTEQERWLVFVEWSGRKALLPITRKALQSREERFRRRARDITDGTPDGCGDLFFGDFGDFGVVVMIIAAIVVLVALGPIIAIVAFAVIEVTIVLLIAAAALIARTLLGRPWRVLAVNGDGETWSWKQVGWGHARELAARIQRELDAGAAPDDVPPGGATPEGQGQLPANLDTGLVGATWVRVTSKIATSALLLWAIITLIARYN